VPRLPARALLAAIALLAAPLPFLPWRGWRAEQERLAEILRTAGGDLPLRVAADVRREPDPRRAAAVAATALLAAELDPRTAGGPDGAERLAAARVLAAGALAARPAAWDAAAVLGASTYLAWARTRDPRLLTSYSSWEEPLLAALARGPGKREPRRFLAAAYLELWPALAPEKRVVARRLLARAFRDQQTFRALIGPWLAVAPSRAEAFALLPPGPDAWWELQSLFAHRREWNEASLAHTRWRRALRKSLEADLAEAEERLRGGDPEGARNLFLTVAARAEQGPRGADLLARALALCPPGPAGAGLAGPLREQLAWVLDRCRVAGCPLSATAVHRLAGFCRDLPLEQAALAALAGDDLERAERIERRAPEWTEAWAPYLIEKARVLARRGRLEEAATALALVHISWERNPFTWRARAELARAAGDGAGEAAARQALARLAAGAWPPSAWKWERGRARLTLLAAAPAGGLAIAIDEAPADRAWVDLRLDGAFAGRFSAAGGQAILLPAPLSPGPHVLDFLAVANGPALPGAVRLLPPAVGPGRRGGP
jgi:hypothetical protein